MMRRARYALLIASLVAGLASRGGAQAAHPEPAFRNPRKLDAVQLLDQRTPNNSIRVRFEWDPVPGATEYILSGKWTSARSWTIHSEEYRVNQKAATQWSEEKVAFEASLPAGNHSWQLVAVFRSLASGDWEHPTLKSFEIK
jgi:hypothetical protein